MHKAFPFCALALSLVYTSVTQAQSLRGSRTSIDRMFHQAVQHDLPFYETASGVRKAHASGELVRLSGNGNYQLKSVSQPYVLPATATFVNRLAAQYRSQCGEKMVITSGTRPKSLRLANSTSKSVHPTGMAVDLRKPRGGSCLTWLRRTLSSLEAEGVLEATEEHRPPHFHVAIFPTAYTRYTQGGKGATKVASKAPVRSSKPAATRVASARSAASAAEGRSYKVRRGDSLWTIARRSNVSVDALKSTNALRSTRIVAGQVLIIPGAN